MPTVLRIGSYRFFFFSRENNEPAHVHIEAAGKEAKIWLASLDLASSYGFRPHELTELVALVGAHQQILMEAWNEHFKHNA